MPLLMQRGFLGLQKGTKMCKKLKWFVASFVVYLFTLSVGYNCITYFENKALKENLTSLIEVLSELQKDDIL